MAVVINGTTGITTPTESVATTIGVGGATPAASGAGITFPATQSASSDANTLDDYEEGTWTPTLDFRTSATGSLTYSQNTGRYIKIGNMVFVSTFIIWTANTFSANVGGLQLEGLPFAAANSSAFRGGLYISYSDVIWSGVTMYSSSFRTESGETNCLFNFVASTNGRNSTEITTYTNIPATGAIMITGSYAVA